MGEILDKVKMIFANTDRIIKGFAIFVFMSCIIVAIFLFLAFLTSSGDETLLISAFTLVVSSFVSFFIYGFGEIISQLKQINYTSYCSYRNTNDSQDKEN